MMRAVNRLWRIGLLATVFAGELMIDAGETIRAGAISDGAARADPARRRHHRKRRRKHHRKHRRHTNPRPATEM
jgi:hypothetical protein